MVPMEGTVSNFSGTISVTKARITRSGFSSLKIERTSGFFISAGRKRETFDLSANSFIASPLLSGGVRTPTTSSPFLIRASNTFSPKGPWPTMMIRIFQPLRNGAPRAKSAAPFPTPMWGDIPATRWRIRVPGLRRARLSSGCRVGRLVG